MSEAGFERFCEGYLRLKICMVYGGGVVESSGVELFCFEDYLDFLTVRVSMMEVVRNVVECTLGRLEIGFSVFLKEIHDRDGGVSLYFC